MIYLATPYSSDKEGVETARFKAVTEAAGSIMERGEIVYSPITHNHPVAQTHCKEWGLTEFMAHDMHFLKLSNKMYILNLPGADDSLGVKEEIAFCDKWRIPYTYIPPLYYVSRETLNNLHFWERD